MVTIAFDLETCLIEPGLLAPPIVCGSYYYVHGGPELVSGCGVMPFHGGELKDFIVNQIFGSNNRIVGHNIAFDMACICAEWPDLMPDVFEWYENGMVHDTMVRQMIAEIALNKRHHSYSLKDCVKRTLGDEVEKGEERVTFAQYRNSPRSEYSDDHIGYALDDARHTWHLFTHQTEKAGEFIRDEANQVRAAFALHLISCWGIRTDRSAVETLAANTIDTIRSLEEELTQAGFLQYNKKDPLKPTKKMKKVRERIQQVFPGGPRTEKGLPSISEDSCRASGDPLLEKYADYSLAASVRDKELPMLYAGVEEPITTRFTPVIATGRVSSSKPREPLRGGNFQNWRRLPGIRECVVPRPGNVFIAADYSAAELHTLAQVCLHLVGKSELAAVLNAGKDPHVMTAANIMSMEYEDVLEQYKFGSTQMKEMRQLAKAANFGFPGGLGPATFIQFAKQGYNVNIDIEGAGELKNIWMETYPEVRDYFDWINRHLDPVTQEMTVEHLYTNRLRGGAMYCQACNSFFQGLCSDGAKAALWAVQKECYVEEDSLLYGCRPVNFVHDEIMIEAPESRCHDAAMSLRDVMILQFNYFVPDVPVMVDVAAMRRWSKKAEAVYDSDKKLVPWDAGD